MFGADGLLWKKRQVSGHFIDFTVADIIQLFFFRCGTSGRVNGSLCRGRYPNSPLVSCFPRIFSHSLPFSPLIPSSSPPLVLLLLDYYKLPLRLRAKCLVLNFLGQFNLLLINVVYSATWLLRNIDLHQTQNLNSVCHIKGK